MRRTRGTPSLVLGLLVGACTSSAPKPDARAKSEPEEVLEAKAEAEPAATPTPAVAACPAEVADYPTALFDERVLLRPPPGVELIEMVPGFAIIQRPVVLECERTISRFMVGMVADPPERSLPAIREELMEAAGYPPSALVWDESAEEGGRLGGVFFAEGGEESGPPARGWVVMFRAQGVVVWALMEASVDDFPALAPLYRASGRTLLVLPPAE